VSLPLPHALRAKGFAYRGSRRPLLPPAEPFITSWSGLESAGTRPKRIFASCMGRVSLPHPQAGTRHAV